MVFSSILFIFVFLPPVLAGYYALHALAPRWWKHAFLTLVSYIFYGWSNPLFMPLMFVSTAIDYLCGRWMSDGFATRARQGDLPLLASGAARTRAQRAAVTLSIVSNLSLLGFFKYCNFGVDSWNALALAFGAQDATVDLALRIALPLGISFYTFQSMSYTIDVYRGNARAIRSFPDFACYVSMFPQLVAGPIIRFQEVADQVLARSHTMEKFARGAAFIAMGLAKKILLADPCGRVADLCFGAHALQAADAWTGVLAYAFQIYFDFSAYSDMAIGLGLLLGFTFAKNFDSPYRADSMSDFWRRWHLSLSTWLRDYLYIPLGGNRLGPRRTYVNLLLVMLLGGLWHGASWNFVVWGAIHGVALALERPGGRKGFYARLPHAARIACTFLLVLLTWVPFRAPDLAATLRYWACMLGLGDATATAGLVTGAIHTTYHMGTVALAALVAFAGVQTWDFTRRLTPLRTAAIAVLFAAALTMLVATSYHPFIYFIF